MTMGVVRTTRRPRSLHQSGGGDAFDDILAPGDVSVPPSWWSPWAARVASTEAVDCGLQGDLLLELAKFSSRFDRSSMQSSAQHF